MLKHFFLSILVALIASIGVLITGCGADTTPPEISDILVTSNTDSSVTISWTTNEPTNSQVEYGTTTFFGSNTTMDTELKTSHSVTISELSISTKYDFRIKSIDASDNEDLSTNLSFSTKADVDNSVAVIQTSMGTIKIELYEKRAPITTANFISLAESDFYDGLIFHRIINDFMIQGGDPLGTGYGGSDETIVLEIHQELRHIDGAISMARSQNPDSASSQFFICDGAQAFLDDNYAVFGKVIVGMEVVRAIAEVPVNASDKPLTDVVMTSVTIE